MIERVGFIGLGHIGEHMAAAQCARFETSVCDLLPEPVERLAGKGAKPASSPRQVGERSQVVGVCVVDDAGTELVVAGEDGVLSGAASGTVIALHGTIHPDTVRRLAEQAEPHGVQLIDAQMTGGPAGAMSRTLRFMVGGAPATFERARPYLEAMGSEITHCGALGLGAVAKLCNNLVQYELWQAIVDAEKLAGGTGLARETLHEVLSWVMNDNARTMLNVRAALEKDPENDAIRTPFTNAMLLAEKDLCLALEVARKAGVGMPQTGLAAQLVARMYGVPDPGRR
jgi:3-hydroxyisobutyrate dehydrogenase-like beta-hydroxyacid dehydrogenase